MGLPNEIHPFLITGNDANQYKVANSVRIRSSASASLTRTPGSTGSQQKATFSFWTKRGDLGTISGNANYLYGVRMTSGNYFWFGFGASDEFQMGEAVSTTQWNLITNRKFRDPSAWYHIVVAIDTTQATSSNRVRLYVNGVEETSFSTSSYPSLNYTHTYLGSSSYIHSLSWSGNNGVYYGANHYLAEVIHIDGQQLTPSAFGYTDTLSNQWVPKQYTGTYGTNGFYLPFNNASLSTDLTSTATLTAPFGGTADNAKVADGVYVTSNISTGSSFTFVQQDFGTSIQLTRYSITNLYFTGGTSTFQVQYSDDDSTYTVAASLSVTGSAQNFTGNLNIKARYIRIRATAFGTNGRANVDLFAIYQDGVGLDSSSNGNNWTPNNISVTSGSTYDVMKDSPTNYDDGGTGRGNYATLNPLSVSSAISLSDANLTVSSSNGSTQQRVGTFILPPGSGKWYFEVNMTLVSAGAGDSLIGISEVLLNTSYTSQYPGSASTSYAVYCYLANSFLQKINNATFTNTNLTPPSTGDIMSVAFDMINGYVWFAKNNTWTDSGNPSTGASPAYSFTPASGSGYTAGFRGGGGGTTVTMGVNFGQRPFAYTPPTGFKALNTYNLLNPSLPLV